MTITINLPLPTDKKIAMERGVLRYFTGEPCKNGHFSERRSKTGECIKCNLEAHARYTKTEKGISKAKEIIGRHKKSGAWKLMTKERQIKHQYGMSLQEYENLHLKQNGVCAICNKPESILSPDGSTPRNLAVDHCHTTGKVRGLLCQSCNTALGKFNDSISLLNKAALYIEKEGEIF